MLNNKQAFVRGWLKEMATNHRFYFQPLWSPKYFQSLAPIVLTNEHKLLSKTRFEAMLLKKKYLEMIEKRYISILLSLNNQQISIGLNEINSKYKKTIRFKGRLTCIVL